MGQLLLGLLKKPNFLPYDVAAGVLRSLFQRACFYCTALRFGVALCGGVAVRRGTAVRIHGCVRDDVLGVVEVKRRLWGSCPCKS